MSRKPHLSDLTLFRLFRTRECWTPVGRDQYWRRNFHNRNHKKM